MLLVNVTPVNLIKLILKNDFYNIMKFINWMSKFI